MKQLLPTLDDMAILALTRDGERELREPGTTLSPAQLEALVLIDGHATVAKLVERARSMNPDVLRASLSELIDKEFVSVDADLAYDAIDPGDFFTSAAARTVTSEVGEHIHAEIDANAEFLRRNGYYVNIARSPAVKHNRADGRKLTVLVIDDDPDIIKVLQICLKLEGLDTHTAANRDEIVAAFRRSPLPDLVLLDVRLTDVNGFDILTKMRQNQALKGLPVIMLTAEATREAVLKGIMGGADGFITKPFQIHNLVKAVKTVLGLKHDPND
ncbi:MAG: response regulator [Gallionella sp.]